MFCSMVYHGSSVFSWKTKAISLGEGPLTLRPFTHTSPELGDNSPPMMLSNVLLPQPLGPSRQTNSLRRISTSTASRAATWRTGEPPAKLLETPRTLIAHAAARIGSSLSFTGRTLPAERFELDR